MSKSVQRKDDPNEETASLVAPNAWGPASPRCCLVCLCLKSVTSELGPFLFSGAGLVGESWPLGEPVKVGTWGITGAGGHQSSEGESFGRFTAETAVSTVVESVPGRKQGKWKPAGDQPARAWLRCGRLAGRWSLFEILSSEGIQDTGRVSATQVSAGPQGEVLGVDTYASRSVTFQDGKLCLWGEGDSPWVIRVSLSL